MNCKKCGAENEESSKFCGKCGHALSQKIICAKCGKQLKPDSEFCGECGAKNDSSTSVIYRRAEAEEMHRKLNSANGGKDEFVKSFWLFLSEFTWWWVPLSLVSFLLIGEGANTPYTNAFIIIVAAVWLSYKFFTWKKWVANPEIITRAPTQPLSVGRLLAAIFFSAIAAYIVASQPDHKSYFHDLPYEAALEEGYSPAEAERMVPQILQVMPYSHTGLFHTLTGWFWFLILTSLYSWRCYKLLVPSKINR